jgi:hypothetical protein
LKTRFLNTLEVPMPNYDRLQITESHTAAARAKNQRIAANLLRLRQDLQRHFFADESREETAVDRRRPERDRARLLRLATWNIREFDSPKYGKRLEESIYYIAEILAQFDLIAIQEVREDRAALDEVVEVLGPEWTYIATDVTEGDAGNFERMAFLYNRSKVQFRGVAGEVMIPESADGETLHLARETRLELSEGEQLVLRDDVQTYHRAGKEKLDEEVRLRLAHPARLLLPEGTRLILPRRTEIRRDAAGQPVFPVDGPLVDVLLQLPPKVIVPDKLTFARTPFLVAFQAGNLTLSLCTVHIYYGSDELGLRRRKAEIYRLVDFLAERAQNEQDSDADSFFFALGDFNIVDRKHETMAALLRHGFRVPEQLQALPGSNVAKDKYYDQIAYWLNPDEDATAVTRVEVKRANIFDFFETVFRLPEVDAADMAAALEQTSLREPVATAVAKAEAKKGAPLDTAELAEVQAGVYADWRTYQMSDHLPMWVELRVDFGDEFLQAVVDA